MPVSFNEGVAHYKTTDIAFPSLMPVSLVQGSMKSACGSSILATRHISFDGLRWRSEMLGLTASSSAEFMTDLMRSASVSRNSFPVRPTTAVRTGA
jgi:hypothetical protein